MAFGHFVLGSHNVMVTALGLCVKWPLVSCVQYEFLTNRNEYLESLWKSFASK